MPTALCPESWLKRRAEEPRKTQEPQERTLPQGELPSPSLPAASSDVSATRRLQAPGGPTASGLLPGLARLSTKEQILELLGAGAVLGHPAPGGPGLGAGLQEPGGDQAVSAVEALERGQGDPGNG